MKGNPIGSADRDRLQKIRTPELSWIQVPSIVKVGPGKKKTQYMNVL